MVWTSGRRVLRPWFAYHVHHHAHDHMHIRMKLRLYMYVFFYHCYNSALSPIMNDVQNKGLTGSAPRILLFNMIYGCQKKKKKQSGPVQQVCCTDSD